MSTMYTAGTGNGPPYTAGTGNGPPWAGIGSFGYTRYAIRFPLSPNLQLATPTAYIGRAWGR